MASCYDNMTDSEPQSQLSGLQAAKPSVSSTTLSGHRSDTIESDISGDIADNKTPVSVHETFDKLCKAVKTLLECIGEDPDREGLVDTPRRYATALLDLTSGNQLNIQDIVGKAVFPEGHHGTVILKDIEIQSLCEHHLLPFFGKIHIGYIPSGVVIGLSKIPRVIHMFSRRLQIQERLTAQISQAIAGAAATDSVAVVMEASHLCMVMRGVEKTGSTTVTSCFLGDFDKPELRSEFLRYAGIHRR